MLNNAIRCIKIENLYVDLLNKYWINLKSETEGSKSISPAIFTGTSKENPCKESDAIVHHFPSEHKLIMPCWAIVRLSNGFWIVADIN